MEGKAMTAAPKTLVEAVRFYADLDHCQTVMIEARWPNGVTCPTCGARDPRYISTRRLWECRTKHPRRQFSAKVGTIFEDSPLGLDKWLPAVWMIANMKNGVSSHELARSLGVTQKTAWFMLHRIRLAMQDDDSGGKIGGHVEVDETYIGGKARNMHRSKRERVIKGTGGMGKVAVQGLLKRHSKGGHSTIRVSVVPNVRKGTLQANVHDCVRRGATVDTDELLSYDGL